MHEEQHQLIVDWFAFRFDQDTYLEALLTNKFGGHSPRKYFYHTSSLLLLFWVGRKKFRRR
jgi:hypothetical protein